MTGPDPIPQEALRGLRRPLTLTRLGMAAERATRAFWPAWSIALAALAALMLGFHETAPLEAVWVAAVSTVLGFVAALALGLRRFRWPSRGEALDRIDRTLPGRPITALSDHQAIGTGDAASEAVWRVHVARMAARVRAAKPVAPNLRIAARDPYALRYAALLLFLVALLFGSVWRVATVGGVVPGASGPSLAAGPTWEGWIEPPAYTGRPSLYLNDIDRETFEVPAGSRVTLRLYGEVGALTVSETVSGRAEGVGGAEPAQEFAITRSGQLAIEGRGGRAWNVAVALDGRPTIRLDGAPERTVTGEMRQPFAASDDYGVTAGRARIALDLARVDRRHGLGVTPEPREPIVVDLPMPLSGERTELAETLIEDFAQHPWAGLPVTITLTAEDASGQTGQSDPAAEVLPGRRFFDPLAAALIEQRRDLLWSKENGERVVQVLRGLSWEPEGLWRSETAYLMLRIAVRRLDNGRIWGGLDETEQAETADALWRIAVLIEDGNLADAAERLRRAEERLSEAIENGATDEEIAALMDELRQAMDDYMRQLAEQAEEDPNQQAQDLSEMQEITGDQLQEMLNQLQELMEQGRMAEAQRLLEQLRQMMENMQVARGQQGQGQSPGEQAMEGLGETLRQQQGLSDEAFRDLQEQFDPGQGQQGQQGQGQQGQGQPGQGQPGQGQPGQGQPGQGQPGQGQPGEGQGQQPGQGQSGDPGQSLADRQEALRRELERQGGNLPGAGTPEGQAARDALDRAGRAMDGAEEALRQDDYAEALDRQSEAIEALREGMRNLGEAMAQEGGQPGTQGEQMGSADPNGGRDPLGREPGSAGGIGTDESLLGGEDVYRRARELLDEIRRRSSEQERPSEELDYLRRLLDRF